MTRRWRRYAPAAIAVAVVLGCTSVVIGHSDTPAARTSVGPRPALASDTRFYAPPPNVGGLRQVSRMRRAGRVQAARRLAAMIDVPQAIWFTEGTPQQVRQYAQETVAAAEDDGSVPALVAYNVPGRDCALYSAGGAATGVAYRAWIDALVEGVGQATAVVTPDRGAGARPTANTGVALVDAYLWVKLPGESDGECYRWTTGPSDPVRHVHDPAAGVWFSAMALELADNALPAFP